MPALVGGSAPTLTPPPSFPGPDRGMGRGVLRAGEKRRPEVNGWGISAPKTEAKDSLLDHRLFARASADDGAVRDAVGELLTKVILSQPH